MARDPRIYNLPPSTASGLPADVRLDPPYQLDAAGMVQYADRPETDWKSDFYLCGSSGYIVTPNPSALTAQNNLMTFPIDATMPYRKLYFGIVADDYSLVAAAGYVNLLYRGAVQLKIPFARTNNTLAFTSFTGGLVLGTDALKCPFNQVLTRGQLSAGMDPFKADQPRPDQAIRSEWFYSDGVNSNWYELQLSPFDVIGVYDSLSVDLRYTGFTPVNGIGLYAFVVACKSSNFKL